MRRETIWGVRHKDVRDGDTQVTQVHTRRRWSDTTPASNPLYGVSRKVQRITRVGSHVRVVAIAICRLVIYVP